MRIGIYNCYWSTLGGGERYAGTMAEILSRQHAVELIGVEPVSVEHLGEHLGLDLSRVRFRDWSAEGSWDLSARTADYDLFINSTFASRLESRAKRSAYVVFFPQQVMRRPLERRLLTAAGRWVATSPPPVEPVAGFYRPEDGCQWSRARATLRLSPEIFRGGGEARLRFRPLTPWPLSEAILDVRGADVDWSVEGSDLLVRRPRSAEGDLEIEILSRRFSPAGRAISADRRYLGVCLDTTAFEGRWRRLRNRVARRLAGRLERFEPDFLETYPQLVAISLFTRDWIERRWGRSSEVLPPPVDTSTFTPPPAAEKERIILAVGRFFHGEHNKKHLEMLRAFRRMCDRGLLPDGWELHLVGNVHRNRMLDMEYYADVERLAEGYPVRLLPDLPFSDLRREYRRAAIFWHATGWGESERRRPEKLEHFGLTTCEAMSSGCIPVVIAKAGQLEIVSPGRSGFLFCNERELITHTGRLARAFGEPWTVEMTARAVEEVQRYGREAFAQRLLALVENGSAD